MCGGGIGRRRRRRRRGQGPKESKTPRPPKQRPTTTRALRGNANAPPLLARECCRECAAAAFLARSPTCPRMCLMMALPLVRFR